jgi:hypothetical protein
MTAVDRAHPYERLANLAGEYVDIGPRKVVHVGIRADGLQDHSPVILRPTAGARSVKDRKAATAD